MWRKRQEYATIHKRSVLLTWVPWLSLPPDIVIGKILIVDFAAGEINELGKIFQPS